MKKRPKRERKKQDRGIVDFIMITNHSRLPICIQGDALYAAEPLMKLCRKNHYRPQI